MPPSGISHPQEAITRLEEVLIRRARRVRRQGYVLDQKTGKYRPPFSAFEPRLPENRPNAKIHDRYLSVNIWSSLEAAGHPPDWHCDHEKFYCAALTNGSCAALSLSVTWEPISDQPDPKDDNPHHGGIGGVVELFRTDRNRYEIVVTELAQASEVIAQCLP